ncbi:putative bifunctional diguanylate cyclase/phosphodiesterase [Oceanisphaera avium]|uniref:GGDEF domain-containing protein n=1 Tax=Oceanisphaera avium TaxID=1903694 RepID=A0A1Y0CW90_9GAMM|nr:EAL domain-containing protein [Oceanisphaera avium]ART79613.1 GGDEF domain-containing protein [Oceanisphaera avium]
MLISIIEQAVLILAFGWLITTNMRQLQAYPRLMPISSGVWFGLITIGCMSLPFSIGPGVLLDVGDSVIFVAGLFGGVLTGGLALLLASVFKVWFNDSDTLVSIISMSFALIFGLLIKLALIRTRFTLSLRYLIPVSLVLNVVSISLIYYHVEPQLKAHVLSMALPFLVVAIPLTLMLIYIIKDTEHRQYEQQALKNSQARLLAITSAIPDMMSVIDEHGRYLEIMADNIIFSDNKDVRRIGKSLHDVYPLEHAERVLDFIQRTLHEKKVLHLLFDLRFDDGLHHFESVAQVLPTPANEPRAVVVLTRDISERVQDDTDLRIAAVAFESFQGMLVTDRHNRILRVNHAFTKVTGYSQAEVLGKTPSIFSSGQHDKSFYKEMWQSIQHQGHWQGEIYDKRKSGQVYPQWLSITAVKDNNQDISHYVASITDLSAEKDNAKKIHHLAYYDSLTGLPNRRFLINTIKEMQKLSASQQRLGALIFLDLDHFKNINDLWGHATGDKLLRHVAHQLSKMLSAQDCLARLGSDQFVLLLNLQASDDVELKNSLAQKISELRDLLDFAYVHGEQTLRTSACLGTVSVDGVKEPAEELLRQAELAMYAAKDIGRGEHCFFDPAMQEAISQRLLLEEDIVRGLAAKEFGVYFQPQFNDEHQLIGVESLVRWHHFERGLLSPFAFIEVAEAAGIMKKIDEVVMLRACEQMAAWSTVAGLSDITVSINVSPAQLYQTGFVEEVLAVVKQTGADLRRLKLEITESMLVTDMNQAISRMRELKAAGIRFSIDDFGTGYSSLQYLQQLPLDQLKIDQSFVRGLPEDASSLAIIRAVIAMAHSLGLEVIAEGVETQTQRDILLANGCQLYQGYLYAKPLPAAKIAELVAINND